MGAFDLRGGMTKRRGGGVFGGGRGTDLEKNGVASVLITPPSGEIEVTTVERR